MNELEDRKSALVSASCISRATLAKPIPVCDVCRGTREPLVHNACGPHVSNKSHRQDEAFRAPFENSNTVRVLRGIHTDNAG